MDKSQQRSLGGEVDKSKTSVQEMTRPIPAGDPMSDVNRPYRPAARHPIRYALRA